MPYMIGFLLGVVVGVLTTRHIVLAVVNGLVMSLITYGMMPVWNLSYYDPYFMVAISFFISLLMSFLLPDCSTKRGYLSPQTYGITFSFGGCVLSLATMLILCGLSSTYLNANRYHELLGEVHHGDLKADLEVLDQSQARIIDASLATKRAHELLGEVPALDSKVNVGDFVSQMYHGKNYLIAPLEHSDFWKWRSNGTTPGYIMVSASNYQDGKLVLNDNGKNISIRYAEQTFFEDDVERHLYETHWSQGLTDFSFSIAPDGRPVWVATLWENTILLGGENVTGVAVIDAQTGDVKDYSMKDIPQWINRMQPEKMVVHQIALWGELVHGAFNWSGRDTLQPTTDAVLVPAANGRTM